MVEVPVSTDVEPPVTQVRLRYISVKCDDKRNVYHKNHMCAHVRCKKTTSLKK